LRRCLATTLLLALAALAGAQNGVAALPRSTTDRPDDFHGLQVHMLYALPSDGVDRSFDTDGSIESSVGAFQRWLVARSGRYLRMDTSQGSLDISFIRLQRTDAETAAQGSLALEAIAPQVNAVFNAPGKLYAVYYDGSNPVVCGNAKWPPNWPGNVAAFYLRGLGGGCFSQGFPPPGGDPTYPTFAMFHDVMHPMGVVGMCAPNHYSANPGHVSDTNTDLMYAGPQPWYPSVLDFGNNDYFRHSNPGCLDLDTVGFLTADIDFQLAVSKAGTGSGTVRTESWGLIDCGSVCAAPYGRGTVVRLTAQETSGTFTGWSGGCSGTSACVVTMDSSKTVTATFTAPPPPPPPPPIAVRRCRVPGVVRRTLPAARRLILRAGCRVGRVRRARSTRARGRVVRQSPRAGARVRRGTRVNLTVSRGRR
jgi:PASTA domain/Divergent InlB B-repeat domain